MSAPRFLAPACGILADGAELLLEPEEARHLRDVLRGGPGDVVELFDGKGSSRPAEVVGLTRREVRLRLGGPVRHEEKQTPEVWLAVAAPKADRLRWLVEKCTELGVDGLIPLLTARSVVKPGTNKLERLEETSLQACKQCGRNRAMEVRALTEWRRFWAEPESEMISEQTIYLLADPDGVSLSTASLQARINAAARIVVLIGPEGGLTDAERHEALTRGATAVSLGRHILRIETAAVAAAAILRSLTAGSERSGR